MIDSTAKGRSFNCTTCPERTKVRRRCREPKMDFTSEDNPSVWPIQIYKGGEYYSFCPAKATWPGPDSAVNKFKTLLVAAMSKAMLVQGGIQDQPTWFIENLSWFLPKYDQVIFMTKVRMVLGDGKKKSTGASHGSNRRVRS